MHPNDGGQYPFPDCAECEDWRKRSKDDVYDVAETTGFASKPLFDYVAGGPDERVPSEVFPAKEGLPKKNKLSRCTRQIVFLKPDVFVMCDRVDSTNAQFPKTWLLHTPGEPTLEGSLYSAEAGEGKLMARRLLPAQAGVRKVGGEALRRGRARGSGRRRVAQRYRSTPRDFWRMEESPTEKRTDDVFLHVLYACDKGTPATAMPKCETISGANVTGAKSGVSRAGRMR